MRRVFYLLLLTALPVCALDDSKPLAAYGRQSWQAGSGLPQNTVHAIAQTSDGYIWLATEGGLVRFDGLRFRVYDAQNTPALPSNNVRSVFEDRTHALWIGTADGLARYASAKFQTFTSRDGLPSNSVLSVYENAAGALCVTTSDGSAEYRGGRFYLSKTEERREMRPEAGVWLGTDHGLERRKNGVVERFAPSDILSNAIILAVYEDREGNVWVGTESDGVHLLRDQKFAVYTNDLVRSIFQARDGTIWIGTNNGLSRFDGHGFSAPIASGISSLVILALTEDAEGNLLVGTPEGLHVMRGGRVTAITSADGLPDDFVRSVFADTDGSIWVGTRRGLAHRVGDTFKTYLQADGLGNDFIGAMLRDREGNLWIGTLGGLTRFSSGKFKNFTTADGLANNVVTALYESSEGALWIGTQGGGLHRFARGKILRVPANGLPDTIYGILEDTRKNLWVSSKTGIFRISKDGGVTPYGTADGLRVSECTEGGHPAVLRSKDGSLWFSTIKGAAVMDARTIEQAPIEPPVVVETFSADDRMFDPAEAGSIELAPGPSRFSFEYAGLNFSAPQRVRFRYRLEGFDREWINAGTRRVAYYTNLRPGNYRFRVAARTYDGDWNESEAAWSFRLEPHFYQTYWFYSLLVALLGLAVYQVYRWRLKQVEARFAAVLAERNRIAREIHDTLAQGFVAVSVQLEVLSRKLAGRGDSTKELLDQTRELVKNSLAEARRSIWDLRSQSGENEDFAARVSKMAAQVTAQTEIKVKLEVSGTYRPVDRKIEDELLRIGQEAVTNVVRHAEARNVQIRLNFDAKKIGMTIADDGQGFVESPANGHYGLQGMRERAEQIGAELKIASTPGKGTQVRVETVIH